jgi:opacity protein-like surface antigen
MTRIFLLLLIALMCAPVAFSQNKDYSFYEFYVGYAYERVDNNADAFDRNGSTRINVALVNFVSENRGYQGFGAEFNQNVTRNIGIVTSFSATFNTSNYRDINSGRSFHASVQRYDLMAGPRYNWRGDSVTPFVHGLFGISHVRAGFEDQDRSDTAFAMALGGGLDVHANDHIDIRVFQLDYLPTFFNGKRQDGIRAGAGIKVR